MDDLPAVVRLAARTIDWGVRTGNAALKLLLTEEGARRLTEELRGHIRRAAGINELEQQLSPPRPTNGTNPVAVLKERGAELLARSADPEDDEAHPAYADILAHLAPDEARILRLLAIEGARAAVDVKSWRPLSSTAETVATGVTLIGVDAGLHRTERVPAYLSNLARLGLVTLTDDQVDNGAYEKLESQPVVQEALKKAGRGRITRRSVRMTAFGKAFSEVCLPIDTAGFLAIQDDIRNAKR
jgi:hypothetical protein